MANKNTPFGLKPIRHLTGGIIRLDERTIADQYNTSIYRGDLVKSTGTGRNIAVCAAGDRAIGVFNDCNFIDSQGNVRWEKSWKASTATNTGTPILARVYTDPDIVFQIQATTIAQADIGNVADMTATVAGNDTTGLSGQQLDDGTLSAAGSAQLKTLGLVQAADNAYGAYAKVEVLINEHELRAAVTAV